MASFRRAPGASLALCVAFTSGLAQGETAAPESSAPIVEAEPDPKRVQEQAIAALHREGESKFAQDDYSGARAAWLDAYRRVPEDAQSWPYRATLLSLMVNATLAEYASEPDSAVIRGIVDELRAALASDSIDESTAQAITSQLERVEPLLDPEPEPRAEQPPVPSPRELRPSSVVIDVGQVRPLRPVSPTVWIAAGSVAIAAGIAAIVAGSLFRPAAQQQVRDGGGSPNEGPGRRFVDDESAKGAAWMASGATVSALGIASLVTGLVQRARDRRPR